MGNRAVVQFKGDENASGVEVYLHWNGGPESVLAFVHTMIDRKWLRADYAPARFCGVVVEFFDGQGDCTGHSVGVYPKGTMGDQGDNGIYEVDFTTEFVKVKQNAKYIGVESLSPNERTKYNGIVQLLESGRKHRQSLSLKAKD